jgi:hypothetical protein
MHLSSSMTGAYLVIVHQTDIVPSLSISTRIGKKLSDLPFAQPPFASLVEFSMTCIIPGKVSDNSLGAASRPIFLADAPPMSLLISGVSRCEDKTKL